MPELVLVGTPLPLPLELGLAGWLGVPVAERLSGWLGVPVPLSDCAWLCVTLGVDTLEGVLERVTPDVNVGLWVLEGVSACDAVGEDVTEGVAPWLGLCDKVCARLVVPVKVRVAVCVALVDCERLEDGDCDGVDTRVLDVVGESPYVWLCEAVFVAACEPLLETVPLPLLENEGVIERLFVCVCEDELVGLRVLVCDTVEGRVGDSLADWVAVCVKLGDWLSERD